MKFEEFSLDTRILRAVSEVGFVSPTPIQEQAVPVGLAGRDVLGLAQTGTGKTAAFMLPILQRLTTGKLRKVRALVIAPTRELAEQIQQASVDLAKYTRIQSVTVYGGVGKGPQVAALRRGAEIVVACPGRLLDLLSEGALDLSGVEVLVLDEADRMCDMGFLPDIRRILKQLPPRRQTLFFSATMPDEFQDLARDMLDNPVTVQIGRSAPVKTVSHALYPVQQGRKKQLLFAMLQRTATGRVIIFTRTKRGARNLALDLDNRGYRVSALQGNMAQNRRQQAISGFRDGKFDILVATDIAARGIDVSEVSHVINYDMPDTVDSYTHRIGRTGRNHQTGEAVTFAIHTDEPMVRQIEKVLGNSIERRRLEDFDYGSVGPSDGPTSGQPHRQASTSTRSKRGGHQGRAQKPAPKNRQRRTSSYSSNRTPSHRRNGST